MFLFLFFWGSRNFSSEKTLVNRNNSDETGLARRLRSGDSRLKHIFVGKLWKKGCIIQKICTINNGLCIPIKRDDILSSINEMTSWEILLRRTRQLGVLNEKISKNLNERFTPVTPVWRHKLQNRDEYVEIANVYYPTAPRITLIPPSQESLASLRHTLQPL